MTPAEAAAEIRATAATFGGGESTIQDFWSSFHDNLHDLCAEDPLDGDWLAAFEALEAWEVATASDRVAAVEQARAVALRLGAVP